MQEDAIKTSKKKHLFDKKKIRDWERETHIAALPHLVDSLRSRIGSGVAGHGAGALGGARRVHVPPTSRPRPHPTPPFLRSPDYKSSRLPRVYPARKRLAEVASDQIVGGGEEKVCLAEIGKVEAINVIVFSSLFFVFVFFLYFIISQTNASSVAHLLT